MKLYPNLVRAVTECLHQIFVKNEYAEKVVRQKLLTNPKWGKRDRHFIASTSYDMVRWWRLICASCDLEGKKLHEKEFYHLIGTWFILQKISLPDWQEFEGLDKAAILTRHEELQTIRKYRQSIPDWLDDLGSNELGERWDTILKALNEPAPIVIRTNTLKISRGGLMQKLERQGKKVSPIDGFPDALLIGGTGSLYRNPLFKSGLFEVQDASSQKVAPFLEVEPGMRVIDACAGAGGKTLHLSALMKNKGTITAFDVANKKIELLRKRAMRSGAMNIHAQKVGVPKSYEMWLDSADRLLLDVPCSGLGVLKRHPDTKWKLKPKHLKQKQELQRSILERYYPLLKVGGKMVYATCSILPSENEKQIEWFLEQYGNQFRLLKEQHCWPDKEGYDGFYMALLEKY